MFYTGEKILSLKDRNGNVPEIYMVTDLRSTGKTTYFIKMLTKRFLKKGQKYVYLVRFENELTSLASAIYKDIQTHALKEYSFESKIKGSGLYASILCDGVEMGYGLPLNSFDKIKRKSHLFTDATSIIFDEFQSEKFKYVTNEINAFHSIHTSLARGNGEMRRYLPIYMLSNHITLLNPYFNAFGLTKLNKNTRFYKGEGFVLEQQFNEGAAKAHKKYGFDKAFVSTDYSDMNTQGKYLLDDDSYICKPTGKNEYIATIIYGGEEYSIRRYLSTGKYHIGRNVDESYPARYFIQKSIGGSNAEFINKCPILTKYLREAFGNGNITMSDLSAKDCLIKTISY